MHPLSAMLIALNIASAFYSAHMGCYGYAVANMGLAVALTWIEGRVGK
jgi:hypothetical protein